MDVVDAFVAACEVAFSADLESETGVVDFVGAAFAVVFAAGGVDFTLFM